MVLLAATALSLPLLAGCGRNGQAAPSGNAKDSLEGADHESQVNVVVETLAPRPFSARLLLVGEVQSENAATLSAQTAGTLQQIVADRGARVRAGDTLLVLDSRRYQAAHDAARAQVENAALDYQMADRLFRNGQGISESDWKKAQNGLRMAEAALAAARIDLENCFVTAPMAGVVAERFVNLGELLAPGVPLLQLVQSDLKVRCGLPENQVGQVTTGMPATVRVPEASLETPGRVRWVGEVLDGRSRTLPLELELPRQSALRPGMACQVEIRHGGTGHSLVVPVTVVQTAPDHLFVYVEEDGRAVHRVVQPGERDGDLIEVRAGLREGDRLIVSGHRGLVDGQALRIVPARGGGEAAAK
jgi:RND family efflux transporter MFP subunit